MKTLENMKVLLLASSLLLVLSIAECKDVDPKLLRCLVCRATVKEIEDSLAKVDPSREVEVGNYRLDADGNMIHKKIPLAQSEVYISDMLDSICDKMSDYVRATYKSNGQLTILNLMGPAGGMNPEMSKVDIIQDGDLNKSLKYYCEGIIEEHEESIIPLFISKEASIKKKLCTDISKLCNPADFQHELEGDIQDDTSDDHDEF